MAIRAFSRKSPARTGLFRHADSPLGYGEAQTTAACAIWLAPSPVFASSHQPFCVRPVADRPDVVMGVESINVTFVFEAYSPPPVAR